MLQLPHKELKRAFALVDTSVREAIAGAEACGRNCACGSDCPHCCKQPIPLTPAELLLIAEFVKKEMPADIRRRWQEALQAVGDDPLKAPCPFLIDGSCSVYPVRPIACRRFLISGKPCKAGEDAYQTRRRDLIVPAPGRRDEALQLLVPWHAANWRELGIAKPEIGQDGLAWLREITTFIQAVDWKSI